MNKCIILSVQPQYLHKILTGKKTIEIRKSMPKCDYPIDVYLYCTKGKPYLYESVEELWWWNDGALEPFGDNYGVRLSDFKLPEKFHDSESRGWNKLLNGFIVAKFTLNKVDIYQIYDNHNEYGTWFKNGLIQLQIKDRKDFYKNSCLNKEDLENYIEIPDIEYYQNDIKTNKNIFYAWHIDNLEIFDNPMELREFYRNCKDYHNGWSGCDDVCGYAENNECYGGKIKINKPPKSWNYAYKD